MEKKKYIIRTVCSILIGLLRIAASLLFIWVCKALVDMATTATDADFMKYVWAMIAIMAVRIISQIADNYLSEYNVQTTKIALQKNIFKRVLSSVWQGRERFKSGDISSRIHEDTRIIIDLFCVCVPNMVVTICQFIAAAIFLFSMAPKLLWLMVILMLVAAIGSKLFFGVLKSLNRLIRRKEAEAQQQIQESLLNRVLVITLFGIDKVLARYSKTQKDIYDATVRRLNYNAVARGFMALGFMSTYGAAFLWGAFGIRNGTVTFGMMTAFLQLVGQIQRPIADLVSQIPYMIKSLASIERVLELYDMDQDKSKKNDIIDEAPTIKVEDISYSYPILPDDGRNTLDKLSELFARIRSLNNASEKNLSRVERIRAKEHRNDPPIMYRDVLKNFSCEFPAGKMTAIMGPTGRGKSTLTRLILSVLKPTDGKITLVASDGEHPCGADQRCNFMYVPQGNSLVSGTIKENLLMAAADPGSVTEERMYSVLHTAAADFVRELPDGLDTMCGEVGTGLSEGQAQRISIARALLHHGSILILDEATSALDAETEEILLDRLKKDYHGKKTILFVSHRDKVFKEADHVIAL